MTEESDTISPENRPPLSRSDLSRHLPLPEREFLMRLSGDRNQRAMFPRLIVVCGGRDYTDRVKIRRVLSEYLPSDLRVDEPTILHGCARGADTLVGEEATDLGFWVGGVEANWRNHGKAAGPIRNRELLDRDPDLVIAFPGGKGTADMVREAKRRGIVVREVD